MTTASEDAAAPRVQILVGDESVITEFNIVSQKARAEVLDLLARLRERAETEGAKLISMDDALCELAVPEEDKGDAADVIAEALNDLGEKGNWQMAPFTRKRFEEFRHQYFQRGRYAGSVLERAVIYRGLAWDGDLHDLIHSVERLAANASSSDAPLEAHEAATLFGAIEQALRELAALDAAPAEPETCAA